MDLKKFAAQTAFGIKTPMKKIGPETVVIGQPVFCMHTGVQLESNAEQFTIAQLDAWKAAGLESIAAIEADMKTLEAVRKQVTKVLAE